MIKKIVLMALGLVLLLASWFAVSPGTMEDWSDFTTGAPSTNINFNWQIFNKTNSSVFLASETIRFFSSWTLVTDQETQIDTILLSFDGTNYTMVQWNGSIDITAVFNYNFSHLPAGNYDFYYFANDTLGLTINQSDDFTLEIVKGDVLVLVPLNETEDDKIFGTDQTVNASATKNVSGVGNVTLYRNTSAVAFGSELAEESNQSRATEETLNYTGCFAEHQNYSASCTTHFAIIRPLACSLSYLPLGTSISNVTCSGVDSINALRTPTNQSNSTSIFAFNNTGGFSIEFNFSINSTPYGWLFWLSQDDNFSNALQLFNTSNTTINSSISPEENLNLWLWINCTNSSTRVTTYTVFDWEYPYVCTEV